MSQVKFGSKQHVGNLIRLLEIAITKNIGRKWDSQEWDQAQRALGMVEAILCLNMPDKFAPGKKFEYSTITSTRQTIFGNIKTSSREESYAEMLLRNLKEHFNTLCELNG